VAGIAARVLQSVVNISVKSTTTGGSGTGSGVVIRSDGYVLTNNHVVDAPGARVTVSFNGAEGIEVPATIVGRDPDTDLAVIKVITDKKLVPAALGQSRSLVVGDPVIAIGSPLGLAGTVTTGIISALNRTVNVPGENGGRTPLFNAIQTDAAINPGNSGGALVDAKGQVIGINSAIATLGGGIGTDPQGGNIGVGFAIPIDEARSVAEELIRTGTATHPAIGVKALTSSTKGQTGALVQEVLAGAPAASAGIRPGDLITAVDKTSVHSVDELIIAIREHKVGQTVTLTYYRNGQKQTARVTLEDNKGN
jgi:putative serine protease PepD